MGRRAILFCAFVTILKSVIGVSAYADGAVGDGDYHLIGLGTKSCGTWVADRHNDEISADMEEQWVLGFLSGVGFVGTNHLDPLSGTDADGVWGWMDNYCQANPLKDIADASSEFVVAHPNKN